MVSFGVQLRTDLLDSADKHLAGLEIIHRLPAIKKGVREACNVVKSDLQARLPKPGYPGDKKDLVPLRSTTRTKVVEYQNGKVLGLVGYDYTGGGQHGHLVEEGHRQVVGGKAPKAGAKQVVAPPAVLKAMGLSESGTRPGQVVGFVPGRYYLQQAASSTEPQQLAAMENAVKEAIEETKRT